MDIEKIEPDLEFIGTIGVDAGCVMVGDPCYHVGDDTDGREHMGKTWSEFCEKWLLKRPLQDVVKIPYPLGHEGQGIVVTSGWGDGVYPVYIKRGEENRIAAIVIDFMGVFEEEDDE